MALVEWAQARGISTTALSVGDCRIEMMPMRSGGRPSATDTTAPTPSMYDVYGGELMDDAARRAHAAGGPDDLVPAVTG